MAAKTTWVVIGLICMLLINFGSTSQDDSNDGFLEEIINVEEQIMEYIDDSDDKLLPPIDLLLHSLERFNTVLSLPSLFTSFDQAILESAIIEAKNCYISNPHYFIEQSNYVSSFSVKSNHTSQGDPYCFPHFSKSKKDKLEFSRWEDQRDDKTLNSCSPIPKIIHQQWKESKIPHEWKAYHHSWKTQNPGWTVMLWTDEAVVEWISTHFPWFVDTFLAFPYAIERADAFRYFLMYAYGGVYVDIDFESLEPLDNFVPLMSRPVGLMTPKNSGFSNSLIISVPHHPFWEFVVSRLGNQTEDDSGSRKRRHVVETTGPKFVNKCVKESETDQVCALSKELFHPCSYCEDICETCSDCYAIHHYAKQWNDWSTSIAHYYDCNPEFFSLIAIFVCLGFFGICLKKRLFVKKRRTHVLLHNQQQSY